MPQLLSGRRGLVRDQRDTRKKHSTRDKKRMVRRQPRKLHVLYLFIGRLSNDDGNRNENVTRKYIFISFVLLRDYFHSLTKNGELSRNQIGRSCVQVKKENEKFTVVRSRSPQNFKCGHFTLLFCRGWQRNVPKCKMHEQSDCFGSLNLLFCGVVVAVVP